MGTPPVVSTKPQPIAVGVPGNPEIDQLLAEMNAALTAAGIDTSKASAYELTLMPSTPTQAVAIPPRAYWPSIIYTLKTAVMPLRNKLGFPLRFRGYRPPDYNEAVGGKPGSRHQWFQALDISVVDGSVAKSTALALEAARIFNNHGKELKMGLGVYGTQEDPTHVHIDTGHQRRTWREARYWISRAQQVS